MKVIRLMNPPGGRAVRMLAGFALIAAGWLTGWPGGVAVALAGLVPLTAGIAGACLVAPLLRAPLRAR
jgi:DUF2892 family protein